MDTNTMVHYLLKTIVIIVCLGGCAFQIVSILKLFFDYPTIVYVDVQSMRKLLLPGITLCNNNRLMMSKLREYDTEFNDKWSLLLNSSNLLNDSDVKLIQQSLIDSSVRNMMNNLPISEFMNFGHSVSDFLDPQYFKCASDQFYPTQACIKFSKSITTAQDVGNCFTLFHRSQSEILQAIAIDSGLSQSPVKRGHHNEAVNIELSEEPFHPNEIVRLKVNFQSDEYTTLNEPVFGHVNIHDDDEVPVIREKSFLLMPGHYYEFFLIKQIDRLLPSPYSTDCVKYKDLFSDGSDDINEYLHHPQSRENCVIGCMAQNTMDKCNCWPPELPFMKGSKQDSQENQMKWCDWDTKPNVQITKTDNTTWFQFCFTEHESDCQLQCKQDCSTDRYRIIKEDRIWPAIERIEHSKRGDYLNEMRKCCAIVSIRYWSSEQTINQYQPKFENAEITSYLGGLLSMWLGFSLLSSYNVFETLIKYIYRYVEQQRQKTHLDGIMETPFSYEQRMAYDAKFRSEQRRKTWQRKARVAAIIERMARLSKSPHESTKY